MSLYEGYHRPPQNTPVDPRMRATTTATATGTVQAHDGQLQRYTGSQQPLVQRQSVQNESPLSTAEEPPTPRDTDKDTTFVIQPHHFRKPKLQASEKTDRCLLKLIYMYKPYTVSVRARAGIWETIQRLVSAEVDDVPAKSINLPSIKYRYNKLINTWAAEKMGSDNVGKKRKGGGIGRPMAKDLKEMCKKIYEDRARGKLNDRGQEEEDADNTLDEMEEVGTSPTTMKSVEDTSTFKRSNSSSLTNMSTFVPQDRSSLDPAMPLEFTPVTEFQPRFASAHFTSDSTPYSVIVPTTTSGAMTPMNASNIDLFELQKEMLQLQRRQLDLMEEDLKWKWEFLAVLRNQKVEDNGVLAMLTKGPGVGTSMRTEWRQG